MENEFGMISPVAFFGITQGYSNSHKALDLGWNNKYGGKNQPIHSIASGIVLAIEEQKYGGNVIFIKHYNGYCSVYAHVEKILVKKGQRVNFYEQIASMGNTGKDKKTGKQLPYHLHFAIYKGSTVIHDGKCYVNPLKMINVFKHQKIANSTKIKYKVLTTKVAKDIPDEPLLIRNKSNSKGVVVGKIFNGDEVTSYGKTLNGWNIVDNVKGYYCYNKWLVD